MWGILYSMQSCCKVMTIIAIMKFPHQLNSLRYTGIFYLIGVNSSRKERNTWTYIIYRHNLYQTYCPAWVCSRTLLVEVSQANGKALYVLCSTESTFIKEKYNKKKDIFLSDTTLNNLVKAIMNWLTRLWPIFVILLKLWA